MEWWWSAFWQSLGCWRCVRISDWSGGQNSVIFCQRWLLWAMWCGVLKHWCSCRLDHACIDIRFWHLSGELWWPTFHPHFSRWIVPICSIWYATTTTQVIMILPYGTWYVRVHTLYDHIQAQINRLFWLYLDYMILLRVLFFNIRAI